MTQSKIASLQLYGYISLIIATAIQLYSTTHLHALYLSVVEIKMSDDSKPSMMIKVFRDDLVDALRLANGDSLESSMTVLNHQEVMSYFNTHVKFYPDPAQDIRLDSYSVEGESYFLDFELLRPLASIDQCRFTYFFELFPNQKNILKIETDGISRFKIFNRGDQIEHFD